MAKKSQVERAIEALEEKRRAVEAKADQEMAALTEAIAVLKAQQGKPVTRKLRVGRAVLSPRESSNAALP